MTRRIGRFILLFIAITISSLALSIFIVDIFTISTLVDAMIYRLYYGLPLIAYLLIFSLILSIVLYTWVRLSHYLANKRMAKGLRELVEGNYHAKQVQRFVSPHAKIQISQGVDKQFALLYSKMTNMALQTIDHQEEQLEKNIQTKEEILAEERHRIARELHDSVSQHLFAASMMLSAVTSQDDLLPESLTAQLKTIEEIINESQSEMRALLLHLRPVALKDKSLKEGIEQLLKELSTKIKIKMNYQLDDVYLKPSVEDQLFRIIQELLSNVLRHAKADELDVYMNQDDQNVRIRVVDDGVGFNVGEMRTGSYGLPNIRERIESIGGSVKIISFTDQGTSIDLNIPINLEEENHD